MCKTNNPRKVDKCMDILIKFFHYYQIPTLACCCGHGKYPMTIVVNDLGKHIDICSGKVIPRKKRFYKKDKQGYYYIPETIKK